MISFQYPQAFILLCVLLGAVYALILYFRHSFIKDPTPAQKRLMKFLGALRFIVITLIAILLLAPFIKSQFTEVQKPIVLLLQDNSESVMNTFSAEDSSAYAAGVKNLSEKLKENYDVKEYSFDESLLPEINFSFDGKMTNLSENLSDLVNLYSGQNIGAVILATDGIYNKGSNPLYAAGNLKFPVYTVALGDTTAKKDLKISKTLYNHIVYLSDRFKIRVDAESDNLSAKTFIDVFDVSERGNSVKLDSREVAFSNEKKFLSEEFVLEAKRPGVQRYQVVLRPVEGEFTRANNTFDLFVDVLDGRQKVLVLANSPHPDVAALREAIEKNKNYEVVLKLAEDAQTVKPGDYNLIILHQLPSARFQLNSIFETIKNKNIATLFITGGQTSFGIFNGLQNAVQISQPGQGVNEALPALNKDFPLFTIPDEVKNRMKDFPPLLAPFGEFETAAGAKVLLTQKIGSVQTEYPLLVFNDAMGSKAGVFCGEGLWRWKMYDYRANGNTDAFNEIITKTVQYLAVKEDKRQFRVRIPKNVFYENEAISFQAELYNDSYELINAPDVSLTLTDEEGKEFPYIFSKTSNAYFLDAGNFPVGNYSYRASVKYGTKELAFDGKFTIVPVQLEAFNTVANHHLLYQLSEKSGGSMFYPAQISSLSDSLAANATMKPLMYSTIKTESIINYWQLLAIFIGILALEWFIRKYEGGY